MQDQQFPLPPGRRDPLVIVLDPEGRIVHANPSCESFLGLALPELKGLPFREVFLPAEGPAIDPGPGSRGTCHAIAGGVRRSFSWTCTGLPEPSGGIEYLIVTGTVEDCAARPARWDSGSEEDLRRALLCAPFPIAIHSEDGKILLVNRTWTEISGYSTEEIPTVEAWCERAYPGHSRAMRERVRAIYDTERDVTEEEYTVVTSSGAERLWRLSVTRLGRLPDGRQTALTIAVDVTERRRLEQQLLHAQKMEAIGQLAGGVAHDFNNLLTVIIGHTYFLLDNPDTPGPSRASIEEIENAAARAAALTRQLLAFSRKQVLQPRVLNLNTTIEETEKMLRRLISENIELTTQLDPRLDPVRVDPGQIVQVIMNVTLNARDAMPHGGKLTIATANVALDASAITDCLDMPAGRYVEVSISDTGSGMDTRTRERIFEPFFTTKPAGKGTGLGLSTAYGILKQSGGYITVESAPGRGSKFSIYLPRLEGHVEEILPGRQDAGPAGTGTILVLEDDPAVRALVREVLRGSGYRVLEASTVAEALRICEQHAAEIPLMVTDVVMPEMSGPEVALRVQPVRPGMKVLYMSGYLDDAVVRHGVVDAGLDFIQKPFAPQALARKVREILERGKQQ
jgi:two-component system, cell cycle sensor histidine kinase and response regulator CckA